MIVSTPEIARATAPSSVTNRVATKIALFTLPATALLTLPFVLESSGLDVVRILLVVPQGMVMAFPFAMVAAVDAIRRHEPLSPQIERAVVVKLGIIAVLLMVSFHGWIVPAANQAWRVKTMPHGMSAPRTRRSRAHHAAIAHRPVARACWRKNQRGWPRRGDSPRIEQPCAFRGPARAAALVALGHARSAAAALVFAAAVLAYDADGDRRVFALNIIGINFARSTAAGAELGVWLPALVFIAVGLIARWWSGPEPIQQDFRRV